MSDQESTSKRKFEPIWGVAANISEERLYGVDGQGTRRGTNKFYTGAKVYIVGAFWGMGGEQVAVVGHFRGKHRYITSVVGAIALENFRAELIHSPTVIDRLLNTRLYVKHPRPFTNIFSKEEAEGAAERYTQLAEYFRTDRQKKRDAFQAELSESDQSDANTNNP